MAIDFPNLINCSYLLLLPNVPQVAASTQFDTVAQEPAVVLPAAQPGFDLEFVQNLLQTQVRKLLKTLHVCSRYNSITGTK